MVLSYCKIIRHDTCALVLSYDLTIYLKCLFIEVDAFLCKYIAPDNKYSDETFQLGIYIEVKHFAQKRNCESYKYYQQNCHPLSFYEN